MTISLKKKQHYFQFNLFVVNRLCQKLKVSKQFFCFELFQTQRVSQNIQKIVIYLKQNT